MTRDLHNWYESVEPTGADELKLDFALELERAMIDAGVNKSDLARMASVSPARVTKALRGDANLTLDSIANFADLLDCTVHVHISKKNVRLRWFEVHTTASNQFSSKNRDHYAKAVVRLCDSESEDLIAL